MVAAATTDVVVSTDSVNTVTSDAVDAVGPVAAVTIASSQSTDNAASTVTSTIQGKKLLKQATLLSRCQACEKIKVIERFNTDNLTRHYMNIIESDCHCRKKETCCCRKKLDKVSTSHDSDACN